MNPIAALIQKLNNASLWDKEMTFERNTFLKEKGSIDTNLYLVTEGSLRIFVIDAHEEHTIRFGYQNNLIASLDSFLNEQPSDFYIQALKKTKVKSISKKKYKAFIESSSEHSTLWLQVLENFVLQQMERERDLLTSSPIERFQRVVKRSPQLFQEIPNKYIASYLRMTPETLSRIKKS